MLIHSHLAPFLKNVKYFDHLVQKFQTGALRYVKCTIFKKKKKKEKDTNKNKQTNKKHRKSVVSFERSHLKHELFF